MLKSPNNNPALVPQGVIFIDKPIGKTSFSLVATLRRRLGVKKIGHCGTLDPLASGLMILLVGRNYTRLADQCLAEEKEYLATLQLGVATDSYDAEGQVTATSELIPTPEQLQEALKGFQGQVDQIPPMFSAKKVKGRKLYELARKGEVIERAAVRVTLNVELLSYQYPNIELRITCSKGTYVRSIAHDLGQTLGCGAHLIALRRTRSGSFRIEESVNLDSPSLSLVEALQQHTAIARAKGIKPCHKATG